MTVRKLSLGKRNIVFMLNIKYLYFTVCTPKPGANGFKIFMMLNMMLNMMLTTKLFLFVKEFT